MSVPFIEILAALSTILVTSHGLYVLDVWNSGRACIDSQVTFFVNLSSSDGNISPSQQFMYIWVNNVQPPDTDRNRNVLFSGYKANLTKIFAWYDAQKSGTYTMNVTVFEFTGQNATDIRMLLQNPFNSLAHGMTNFMLTENFNTAVNIGQNFTRRKSYPEDMFVAGYPITAGAKVIDHFVNSTFEFKWEANNERIFTRIPHIDVVFQYEIDSHVLLDAVAHVNVTDLNKNIQMVDRNSVKVRKRISIRELLSDIEIEAEDRVYVDAEFLVNVTCSGSAPFTIAWTIPGPFEYSPVYKGMLSNSSHCSCVISHVFTDPGNYSIKVTVENPVDVQKTEFHVIATPVTYAPIVHPPTSLAVPLLSVIVAIIIVILLTWSYLSTKQQRRVETADFEFYAPTPHAPTKPSHSFVAIVNHSLKNSLKRFSRRFEDNKDENRAMELHLLTTDYGSMDSEMQNSLCRQ